MLVSVVDPCGSETGDITGKIEVYDLNEELETIFNKSNNTIKFYNKYLKDREPKEIRSGDLEAIIVV